MTGQFLVPHGAALRLSTGPRTGDGVWPPRFTKIRMTFEDGGELAMTNARRLGRIRLREDPEREPPVGRLGFDPLLDLPDARTLHELTSRRKICLKGLLLDQRFAAGVGNWIADEVLYQARLDPRRPASSLGPEEVRRLRARLRAVVERAVSVNADKSRYPRGWLFHRRWGRAKDARTGRGEPIEHLTLAGRTTAWVPSVQK
jgi:formamidopyrimidine-DNA glycosylase